MAGDVRMYRSDRLPAQVAVTATSAAGATAAVTSVAVAVLPRGRTPDATATWTPVTYANGCATFEIAGPDANPAGALVIPPMGADLYVRDVAAPLSQAAFAGRIRMI